MSAENPGARPATAQAPGVRTPVAARSVYGAGLQADGYLIGERLKPGGMSEVRLGMELASGCCVVLKSVPCEDEESPELEARLAQEAEVLGRLEHPDIAKMMDFKVIAGRPRLVMELVEGVSLREFLKKQPTVEQKLALLERVARAVSHAHMRGVAHRDLKPDNVMVRADGSPVVLDFGIAALLDAAGAKLSSLTRTGLAPGTPHYMAPEQARGDSRHPAAADVYALGVLLFEMLSGSLPVEPHEQETEAVYLQRVLSEEPRNLRDVQPDLRRGRDLAAICAEALTREPGKRPSAEALAEDLRRWLELKPVRARTR